MFEKNPYFGGGDDGGAPVLPLDGDLPLIVALVVTGLVMALVLCKMMDRRARRDDRDEMPDDATAATQSAPPLPVSGTPHGG